MARPPSTPDATNPETLAPTTCLALVGELPAEIRRQVDAVDAWESQRVPSFEALVELVRERDGGTVLVVSLELSQSQCRRVAEVVVSGVSPVQLGFVVGRDAQQLATILARLASPPETAQSGQRGPNVAYVEDSMLTGDLPAALDAKAWGGTPRGTAEMFARPAEVTYLSGHSNSQCQGGGGGIAMCTRDEQPAVPQGAPQLPCFRGAPCRFSPEQRVRVRSSDLRSRILVNLTCFGHYFSGETYAAESAVSAGYWRSHELRSMLTTFGPVYFSETDFLTAYYLLNAGSTVGQAAHAMNAGRVSRGDTVAVACVGDPGQRVVASVVRGELGRQDRGLVLSRPAGVEGSCDLWVQLEPGPGRVVVVDEGEVLAGALLPDGRLFVSLDARTDTVCLRAMALSEARSHLDFAPLGPALEALDMFHQGAVDHVRQRESLQALVAEDLSRAISLRALLIDTVRRSRPALLGAGQVFDAASLFLSRDSVYEILEALVGAMVRVYEHLLPLRGGVFPLLAPYLARTSTAVAPSPCKYCGSRVAESRLEGWDGRVVRVSGECDLCGTVYQDNAGAKWIEAPDHTAAGREVTVRMAVQNPFPFPVPAGGAVAFQSFVGAHGASVRFEPIELDAHASGVLEAQLSIPVAAASGVQRLTAATVVGAHLGHCRRDVQIVHKRDGHRLNVLAGNLSEGEG